MEPDPVDRDQVAEAPPETSAFEHPLARHLELLPPVALFDDTMFPGTRAQDKSPMVL